MVCMIIVLLYPGIYIELLLDTSVTTSSASGVNLKEPTALTWLLVVLVFVLVDGAFTVEDFMMGVYNRQMKTTDTEINFSQCIGLSQRAIQILKSNDLY